MLDIKNVIKAVNKTLKPFFIKNEGGFFSLSYYSPNLLRLKASEYSCKAFDKYGNDVRELDVVKWFSDYWLFIEIKFHHPHSILLTVSVFQGKEFDKIKKQLFRAEWDDYGDDKTYHPQPHWHFLEDKSFKSSVNTFSEIASEDAKDTFKDFMEEDNNKSIDLSKFHFAMNGDWYNTSVHVHPVNNVDRLAQWFGGLLAYLKTELEYIDKRRGVLS